MSLFNPDSHSTEVMARFFICGHDGIMEIETFCYECIEEDPRRPSDAEWVQTHTEACFDAEDVREWLEIKDEEGVYQILLKGRMHGWYSGWETPEYEEEFEISHSEIKKMSDDWFGQLIDAKNESLHRDMGTLTSESESDP